MNYLSIIIKLDVCDIAFLCNASPQKALIVQYCSDGHSIIFMPVSNVVNKLFSYLVCTSALCHFFLFIAHGITIEVNNENLIMVHKIVNKSMFVKNKIVMILNLQENFAAVRSRSRSNNNFIFTVHRMEQNASNTHSSSFL